MSNFLIELFYPFIIGIGLQILMSHFGVLIFSIQWFIIILSSGILYTVIIKSIKNVNR